MSPFTFALTALFGVAITALVIALVIVSTRPGGRHHRRRAWGAIGQVSELRDDKTLRMRRPVDPDLLPEVLR